jgi:hypothetical protein
LRGSTAARRLLTDKWRALYRQAQCDAGARAAASALSAQILAECDSFESAIGIRDGARDVRPARLCEYCAAYRRQFECMLRRHDAEFDQLHVLLRNYVFMLKQQADEVMMQVEAEHMRKESEQRANLIGIVLQAMDGSAQRTATIDQISGRDVDRRQMVAGKSGRVRKKWQ